MFENSCSIIEIIPVQKLSKMSFLNQGINFHSTIQFYGRQFSEDYHLEFPKKSDCNAYVSSLI